MDRNAIRDAVLEIIRFIDEDLELDDLKDEEPLREQLDLDSMDFLDIVMELRKRYRVEVPEADYPELISMKSTVDYLEPRLKDA